MNNTKIDFKNVLAGIGVGAVVLFLILLVLIKTAPTGGLTALLLGDDSIDSLTLSTSNNSDYALSEGDVAESPAGEFNCGSNEEFNYRNITSDHAVTDSSGNIFSYQLSDLVKKDLNGKDISTLSFSPLLIGDSIFYDGYIYITTYSIGVSGGGISKVDPSTNTVVSSWTKHGTSLFFQATEIAKAKDGNKFYIVEQGFNNNTVIYLLDLSTNPNAINIKNLTLSSKEIISGMTVDNNGNLYIASNTKNTLTKYTSDMSLIWVKGGLPVGSGNGQFNNIKDVTVGPDGNIYVADAGNNRIQIFNTDGLFINQLIDSVSDPKNGGYLNDVKSIAFDKDGYMYIVGSKGIKRFAKPCAILNIKKITVPQATDKFSFWGYNYFQTKKYNLPSFSLANGEIQTMSILSSSPQLIGETADSKYNTKVNCTSVPKLFLPDSISYSGGKGTDTTINMSVENGKVNNPSFASGAKYNITCIFTNTKKGYIPVDEKADPYAPPINP